MIFDLTSVGTVLGKLCGRHKVLDVATHGIVLGMTTAGTPVLWPAPSAERASHAVVLAASGAGKTILVANTILSEIVATPKSASASPHAIVVIDPKGDLGFALLQGIAFAAPEKLSEIIYINPFSASAFPFNLRLLARGNTPADIRAMQLANLVSQVSTASGSVAHLGTGARQQDVLLHVLLGALEATDARGATVLWAHDALCEPHGLKLLAGFTASVRSKAFLQSAVLSDELRASCSSRLRTAFAATAQMERIVTAPSCIQFTDLLSPGRITIADIGNPIGGLTGLQSFWANMLVRLLVEHLMERPSPFAGHHVRMVIDEAQIVAPVLADVAERVLTTGRSRNVSLVMLSQGTAMLNQYSDTLLQVLLTNTNMKLIGRLAVQDAQLLAKMQSPRSGVDESIGSTRDRFLTSVCNLDDREFYALTPGSREKFTAATVDMAAWKDAAERHASDIEAVKTRLALPPNLPSRLTLKEAADEAKAAAAVTKKKPTAKGQQKPSPARSRWG